MDEAGEMEPSFGLALTEEPPVAGSSGTLSSSRPQQELSREEHDIFNADFIFPDENGSTYTNEDAGSIIFQQSIGNCPMFVIWIL